MARKSKPIVPDELGVFLNRFPLWFDSYEAIASSIASGDVDMAWELVRMHHRRAQAMKGQYLKALDRHERNKKRLNEATNEHLHN